MSCTSFLFPLYLRPAFLPPNAATSLSNTLAVLCGSGQPTADEETGTRATHRLKPSPGAKPGEVAGLVLATKL